jgi:hypothetical protein
MDGYTYMHPTIINNFIFAFFFKNNFSFCVIERTSMIAISVVLRKAHRTGVCVCVTGQSGKELNAR